MNFSQCLVAVGLLSFLFIGFADQADAQDSYRVSAQAGFQVLNSDHVTTADNEGNQAWVFGLGVSSRRVINDLPFDFSLSFSQGQTEIIEQRFTMNNGTSNSTDLRYRSLTAEAMRVFGLSDLVEFSLGLNLVPQYRTLIYDFENMNLNHDRLLSFGLGVSGKLSLIQFFSENRKRGLDFGISARWTEFFIHHARNRPIDGFRYRHLLISPHVGVRF